MFREEVFHLFLVEASTPELAFSQVLKFLSTYQLVRYDEIKVLEKETLGLRDPSFWETLEKGLTKNLEVLKSFVDDLNQEGYVNIKDLLFLPQGYLSKIFHLIAHLLDGFFGIDFYFYNLVEDSHFISHQLRQKLKKEETGYFLVPVKAYFDEKIYSFETISPKKFFKI
ncbi:hypothetical protein [Thermodesulfobacterium thermophilum]|uniref:hypothetical protein n=1 Tax=Thermodesulfobacterium thermophilum TaxID=886 RepID=UPI0003B5BAE4|nr:hypothetical protein [Thermodesulfobacterium thermophilum]